MGRRNASVTATAAVLAVAGLLTLVVAWAATLGTGSLLRDGQPARSGGTPTPSPSDELRTGVDPATLAGSDQEWVGVLLVLVELAAGGVLLVLGLLLVRGTWRAVLRWWTRRSGRRRPDPAGEVRFEVVDAPAALAQRVVAAADRQRRLLVEGGSPRNAIVACWQEFEELASTVGLERHSWETSSEFTLRILNDADADGAAAARLAELYREARFSTHPLGEEARRAALTALDEIQESLRVRALFRAGGVR